MNPIVRALALASSVFSVAALAAEPAAAPAVNTDALYKKNACVACHSPTTKVVGPAFKDVAAKYRGNKGAEQILFDKVRKGGTGIWGKVPMPPNAAVPDADLHAMIKSILSKN